jgi:hypothetical protein
MSIFFLPFRGLPAYGGAGGDQGSGFKGSRVNLEFGHMTAIISAKLSERCYKRQV